MQKIEQAILLCGGFGTRLQDLYPDIPKALVPVAGKPIIHRQIDWLLSLGVRHVHIAAGYKADVIKNWHEETPSMHDVVSISVEPEPLGTAGGTKFAISKTSNQDNYIVVNGDSLLPSLTLEQLCSELSHPIEMTMGVTEISDASRYGTVKINSGNVAESFLEKSGSVETGWVNTGVYNLSRGVMNAIPDNQACSLEKDIFPVLANERKIKCVKFPPPLLDMGTPSGLDAMTNFLLSDEPDS